MELNIDFKQKRAQPSRKGKKSWRKNVDITEIEEGLNEINDQERLLGKNLKDVDSNSLFIIDTEGNQELLKNKKIKRLRCDEILAERSAVPKVVTHQRSINKHGKKNVEGVSGKQISNLMKKAGKGENNSKLIGEDLEYGDYDDSFSNLWDDKNVSKKSYLNSNQFPHVQKLASFPSALRRPSTISNPTILFTTEKTAFSKPDPGRSYNPSYQSWKTLVSDVANEELKRYKREEATLLAGKKIKSMLKNRPDDEDDDTSSSDSEDDENDASSSELNDRLSVNAPVVMKRKTKTQRNKEKKQKERLLREKQNKDSVQIIRQIQSLSLKKRNQMNSIDKSDIYKKKNIIRKHKFGKHNVIPKPLDVKLSDELIGSLRAVKAEGNLSKDLFASFQMRGIIEARIRRNKKKQRSKVVEKWSYKDFK